MGTAWMGVSDACVMEWVAMRFRGSFLNLSKGTNTICRISSHFGHHSPREMLDLTMRTPGQAQWRARVLSGVKKQDPRRRELPSNLMRPSTSFEAWEGSQAGWEFSSYRSHDLSSSRSNWNEALCTRAESLTLQFEQNLFQKKIAHFLSTKSRGKVHSNGSSLKTLNTSMLLEYFLQINWQLPLDVVHVPEQFKYQSGDWLD